ncbi:MAG: hypothetical protein KBT48_10690 [Firmicutes bacterium]|nr:hypothetical protein [Bacillota bacterium]
MNTNLIELKENQFTYTILSSFPLSQIYYEGEHGKIDTRTRDKISVIYLKEISKIVNTMSVLMEKGISMEKAFREAVFDNYRLEILEDYAEGFINQQQLSDYLRDSYKDEDLSKGALMNDVYIR